jgi:hypothetical protein
MVRAVSIGFMLLGCTPSRGFLEIEQPAYWWRVDDGLCGHNLVVDRDHVLWGEGGCETGPQELEKSRELTVAEFDALSKAYAQLPKPTQVTEECQGIRHQFSIGQRDTGRVWSLCAPKSDYWDARAIPPPYDEVVRRFRDAATSR